MVNDLNDIATKKVSGFDTYFSGGVFLMLGYSSTDEALLRPYTNLGVQDTIRGLQYYVNKHIENQVNIQFDNSNVKTTNLFQRKIFQYFNLNTFHPEALYIII